MKKTFKELHDKKEKLEKELEKVDAAIEALQEVCDHDMVYDGHDSHHNYHKCSICNYTESD